MYYKDMSFCAREGCPVKKCPRNMAQVDWSDDPFHERLLSACDTMCFMDK